MQMDTAALAGKAEMTQSWKNRIGRYTLVPLSLGLALLFSEALHSHVPDVEFYLFLAAVVIAGWFGGLAPGLLAAALAPFVLDYFFLPPLYTLGIDPGARPYIVPFLLASFAAVWMSSTRAATREAHQALRKSEEKYRKILTNLPDGSWTADRDHQLVYFSPKIEQLLGYSGEEIRASGRAPNHEKIHPDDRIRVSNALEALFQSQIPFDEELRVQKRDGTWMWVHIKALRTRKESGTVYADGLLSDITVRKQAELELTAKTAFLEALVNVPIDGILVVGADRRRVLQNQKLIDMFEIPAHLLADPDQIPVRRFMMRKFKEPEKVEALIEYLYSHPEESGRHEVVLKDGGTLDLYSSPVKGPGGKNFGRIWNFRDVTARKQNELELKSKTAFLEAQVNASIDGILVVDEHGHRQLINRRFIDFFSVPQEILANPDDAPLLQHMLQLTRDPKTFLERIQHLYSHTVETSRDEIEFKDGRVFDRYSAPITDKDWNYFGRIWTFRDITERKRNEDTLRQLSIAIEQSPVSVVLMNPDGGVSYVNRRFSESTGYLAEDVVGSNWFKLQSESTSQPQYAALWSAMRKGKEWHGELRNKKKNGQPYWAAVAVTPILDGNGAISHFVAIKEDITERRAMENELRQSQKLEGIGQLAAGIAHEINTPTQFVTDNLTFLQESWRAVFPLLDLYIKRARSELAKAAPDVAAEIAAAEQGCDLQFITEEVPHAISQSLDGARRVAAIVRAMKEFSHPDSAEKTDTDLNQAILATITVARNEWKYVAEVTTCFDQSLAPVHCYPGEINQVILNLVVNAAQSIRDKVKDGEKGAISICTRRKGSFAEISVSDTGMGIPEEIQSRIYEPFFTTKEVGRGTGQGLALAHSVVVKKHLGKIWFETEIGRGTTFFIDLPIRDTHAAEER